ncbi:DUF421 domain-containing protein [Salinimonas sediminis]|uniref:DUF421 domain-containing protein n=1 Tax=Salinimonas sediminis TaxID=2303538 RepID=A0A346NKX7_9ALTE|nr:YetF domain-containing protein [Salinimonas sediminis]AXR06184.1 DUF421 domain-containing protein [Salinimonas sediminis]
MIFFQNWHELFRVLVTALATYTICVTFISLFGKRSTAKMNNFDWIVTVAMGSILGSSVLLKKVVVIEVALGLLTLLILQYGFTKLSVHSSLFRRTMKKSPTLLYYAGDFLSVNMQKERITKEEILSNMRIQGFASQQQVMAVIVEPSGELSVIPFVDGEHSDGSKPADLAAQYPLVDRVRPTGVD